MIRDFPIRLGLPAFLILVAWSAAQPAAGQGPASTTWTVPRTPSGQPDLEGVWSNNGVTPLQRPEALKDREFLTDAEVANLKRRAAELFESQQAGDSDRRSAVPGNHQGSQPAAVRSRHRQLQLVLARRSQRRQPHVPHHRSAERPDAAARCQTGTGAPATAAAGAAGPANPEDVNLNERCITYGVPWLVAGYNSYIQIFQTPNYVAILQEMIHDVRIVPLDGRPHVDGSVRLWNGDSRGRFEGDTLVVTTTNYSPKTRLQGSSENLRLVERFRRVSPDTLEYRLTFEDPTVWTAPWTMMIPLKRSNEQVHEYACHEGNHSLTGILAGARTLEKDGGSSRR